VSASQRGPDPEQAARTSEQFLGVVRASEEPVWALRTWTTIASGDGLFEASYVRVHYAVRAETAEGPRKVRFTEHLPVHEVTGRIAAPEESVWRWLRRNARERLYIDRGRSGAL